MPKDRHADAHPVSTIHTPSQRQRNNWVHIHDLLLKLNPLAAGNVKLALLLYGNDRSRLWKFIFFELHQLTDLTWNILTGVQPTIHPNELYKRLHDVRNRWMQLSRCDESGDDAEEDRSSHEGMDETELFERLMSHVKELMAITPS